jgi:membrane-associated protein
MPAWLEPNFLIQTFGLLGVLAIVFTESGLLIGVFLPGDSLLFTAGFLAAGGYLNIWWLAAGAGLAAILGDSFGYWLGARLGPTLFSRPRSRWFNPAHLEKTKNFYAQHGRRTIILARFVPIVRTFVPLLAGVGRMEYGVFLTYNIVGGLLWGSGVSLLGYTLGTLLPNAERYLGYIIAVIIVVSLLPALKQFRYNKVDEG